MDLVPTIFIYSRQVSRHSGRVVIELDQFIYLGESFEAIIKEHEIDHTCIERQSWRWFKNKWAIKC